MQPAAQVTDATREILILKEHIDNGISQKELEQAGYNVNYLTRLQLQNQQIRLSDFETIIIDLHQPSIDGVTICKDLRRDYQGPIIVLSPAADEMIQLLALELGADDFLIKPQTTVILASKIRTLLRRSAVSLNQENATIRLGGLQIDAGRREVLCKGESVPLTDREFDLLWCLARNTHTILSREEIHQALYKREYNGYDRSIDVYISRIRRKIGDDPIHPHYLKTIRGAGYLLVADRA